jgi:hypothetical protein
MRPRHRFAITVAAALAAPVCAAPAAPPPVPQAQASTAHPSDSWSLKGIALGSSPEALLALFPAAVCHGYTDPLIRTCTAQTTLIGMPADLKVEFLRGEAVLVALGGLSDDQRYAAVTALKDKYGDVEPEMHTLPTFARGSGKIISVHGETRSRWSDGPIVLAEVPHDSYDVKSNTIVSQILLVNVRLEGDDFWPRSQGKAPIPKADL